MREKQVEIAIAVDVARFDSHAGFRSTRGIERIANLEGAL